MSRACCAVAWHPHDEDLLAFAVSDSGPRVHIVGEQQHSGPSVARLWHFNWQLTLTAHLHKPCMQTSCSLQATTFPADVRFPYKDQQLVMRKVDFDNASMINGLCISPDNRLWVATNVSEPANGLANCAAWTASKVAAVWPQVGLQALQLVCLWSTNTHKHWPRPFKALVRELLVGCLARHTHGAAAGAQSTLLCP